MKAYIVQLILLATTLAASADETSTEDTPEPCKVRAWVRAEDLLPKHVCRRELCIQVSRAECTNQVASVTLRLQFDELGEFTYLKKGAVIPELQPLNQTAPAAFADWTGSDVVLDYQAHDDAMSDPELWTVRAKERRAWTIGVMLLLGIPDLSHPIITSFTVAVPAVNYPPVIAKYRNFYEHVAQHSFSDLGDRYIAFIKFVDGRAEHVLAGHTTFVPASETQPHSVPFIANRTFTDPGCGGGYLIARKHAERLENCLPEAQRSTFVAEITLEDGSVVQQDTSKNVVASVYERLRIPVVATSHSSGTNSIVPYLSPRAPVFQRGREAEKPVSFPLVEALANTSARLMQSGTSDPSKWMQEQMNFSHKVIMNSDPTQDYRGGSYTGLHWKKVVAEVPHATAVDPIPQLATSVCWWPSWIIGVDPIAYTSLFKRVRDAALRWLLKHQQLGWDLVKDLRGQLIYFELCIGGRPQF